MTDLNAPPHSREAERCVLGSMLRDNGTIGDVLQIVRGDDFYHDNHQKIFAAIVALNGQGEPADLVTLAEELKRRKQVEDVGNYPYLAELWDAAPAAANAEYYARIVLDKAIKRRLVHAGLRIARDAQDQVAPGSELLEQAEKEIFEAAQLRLTGQTYPISAVVKEVFDRIDERSKRGAGDGTVTGIPTGFIDLDRLTGGLQNSELIIVGARPSVGKTSLGLCVARHVALEEGLTVLFFSLEQSRLELVERLLCCQASVDSQRLRRSMVDRQTGERLAQAGAALSDPSNIFIDDSAGQGMTRIASNARRYKLRYDVRLVVVDYLQLIEPDNPREIRQEQVAKVSRRLKHLARELQIPVLVMAQVKRFEGKRPQLSDLRESGGIEADADVVMLLHPYNESPSPSKNGRGAGKNGEHAAEDPPRPDLVGVYVDKQRNGPTGEVPLFYRKPFVRFENYAPDPLFEAPAATE